MESEFKIWLKEWRAKRLKAPWWLSVQIDKQFKEGYFICVTAFPIKEDEIPICMLKEPLTKGNAKPLKTALTIIEKMQGIKIDQSISFMMQIVIMVKDFYRAKKKEKSIFEGLQRGDIPESKITEILERAKPMFSLEEVLYDWHEWAGRFSGGFMKKPTGFLCVPQYTTIPSGWIKIDNYKEIYGEGAQLPKIATTLDPLELQLVPLVKGLSEYAAFYDGKGPLQISEQKPEKGKDILFTPEYTRAMHADKLMLDRARFVKDGPLKRLWQKHSGNKKRVALPCNELAEALLDVVSQMEKGNREIVLQNFPGGITEESVFNNYHKTEKQKRG